MNARTVSFLPIERIPEEMVVAANRDIKIFSGQLAGAPIRIGAFNGKELVGFVSGSPRNNQEVELIAFWLSQNIGFQG